MLWSLLLFLFNFTVISGFDGGFRDVALEVHNEMRSKLNLAPLRSDSGLNIVAQKHANSLALEEKFHGSGAGYGHRENLWAYYGDLRLLSIDVTEAVTTWFSSVSPKLEIQVKTTNILVETNEKILISNDTSLVGIGVETNPVGYTVVVANYL